MIIGPNSARLAIGSALVAAVLGVLNTPMIEKSSRSKNINVVPFEQVERLAPYRDYVRRELQGQSWFADARVSIGSDKVALLWKGSLSTKARKTLAFLHRRGVSTQIVSARYSDGELAGARALIYLSNLTTGSGWRVSQIGTARDYSALIVEVARAHGVSSPSESMFEMETGVRVQLRVRTTS